MKAKRLLILTILFFCSQFTFSQNYPINSKDSNSNLNKNELVVNFNKEQFNEILKKSEPNFANKWGIFIASILTIIVSSYFAIHQIRLSGKNVISHIENNNKERRINDIRIYISEFSTCAQLMSISNNLICG